MRLKLGLLPLVWIKLEPSTALHRNCRSIFFNFPDVNALRPFAYVTKLKLMRKNNDMEKPAQSERHM